MVLPHDNNRLSIIEVGGNDAVIIFGVNGSGGFESGTQYILNKDI